MDGSNEQAIPIDAAGSVVTLDKAGHRWTFSCAPGDEADLMRSASEMAARAGAPFDHFDAALISHQIARRLRPGLNRVAPDAEKDMDG